VAPNASHKKVSNHCPTWFLGYDSLFRYRIFQLTPKAKRGRLKRTSPVSCPWKTQAKKSLSQLPSLGF